MSAFIVPRAHVAALVRWYSSNSENWDQDRHADGYALALAECLMAENVRSVAHRYDETPEDFPRFTEREILKAPALSPVQVLKAIACLDYQSCETDEWRSTKACKLLERMQSLAINSLDGYDAAPWSIDEGTLAKGLGIKLPKKGESPTGPAALPLPTLTDVLADISKPWNIAEMARRGGVAVPAPAAPESLADRMEATAGAVEGAGAGEFLSDRETVDLAEAVADAGMLLREGARRLRALGDSAAYRPDCPHSACSQHFIDTGSTECVQGGKDGERWADWLGKGAPEDARTGQYFVLWRSGEEWYSATLYPKTPEADDFGKAWADTDYYGPHPWHGAALAALAIEDELPKAERAKGPEDLVCPECGSDALHATAWILLRTEEVLGDDPPTDDCWCPNCDAKGRDGTVGHPVTRAEFEESPEAKARECDACGDTAWDVEIGSPCGRDLSDGYEGKGDSSICQGVYRARS